MPDRDAADSGVRTLLDLSGHILDQEDGYWIKIDAWQVAPTLDIPHGIRYSLTLHAPSGKRILGYDNAHAVTPRMRGRISGRRLPFDHKHRQAGDTGIPYVFRNAHQLLQEFFQEADRVMNEVRKK